MRKYIAIIILMCMARLCFAEVQTITHDFTNMQSTGTLTFESNYTVGVTPDFRYIGGPSGTSTGTFGASGIPLSYYISLPKNGSYMYTSTAINDLKAIRISHASGTFSNLQIWISEDGTNYTNVSSSAEYGNGYVVLTLAEKGNYYIKFQSNKNNTDPKITKVNYDYEPCHCLRVISQ